MDELGQEQAKHDAERAQYTAQTNGLFEESNRLCLATDAAHDMQERFRREMDVRISRQDKILQPIQSQYTYTANGISSPVKKLLNAYQELNEHSSQALWNAAISTNNTELQCALFALQDDNKNQITLGIMQNWQRNSLS